MSIGNFQDMPIFAPCYFPYCVKQTILHLAALAQKPQRLIIGLMSGTSLDGLDVALCRFTGAGAGVKTELLEFETLPYDESFKSEIRRVFAQKTIEFQHLTLMNVLVAEKHAALVLQCLKKWNIRPDAVDLLASHGQTVFHAPRAWHHLENYPNATLQIGDGDHLARRTGVITIADFRQKHLAAGGEGAPLALYGDYLLFSKPGCDRLLLNIGGIANFTWLPASGKARDALATDTGPGNTLLDTFARELFGVPFDEDALLAYAGRVDEALLALLKEEPFFAQPFPKTTGPELFSKAWVEAALSRYPKGKPNPYDLMSTLTKLTADTIARAVEAVCGKSNAVREIFPSGGGAHNPLIVKWLQEQLPGWHFRNMADLGVPGDAKEALLFAALANETVAGETGPDAILGGVPWIGMGKICLPD